MIKILIADSGSTKTDWVLVNINTGDYRMLHTIGYNPYFLDTAAICSSLTENLVKDILVDEIAAVYFYGAGCSTINQANKVSMALKQIFTKTKTIFVGHDMLGSARALLGNNSGFAAIIGTGSNTCFYNGNHCELNIDSLGYLLGDEGSGSYIGKKFLRDYMRNLLEPEMQKHFKEKFKIESNEQILKTLYSHQFPNRYLASFFRFADDFPDHPYILNNVKDSFNDFFKNLVSKYPNYQSYTFSCVGSVAFIFKDILQKVAKEYNMQTGKIIKSPLTDLINYHCNNNG